MASSRPLLPVPQGSITTPQTGESLGLLVEEARTNSQTYSQDFADASWLKLATVVPNAGLAPDGTSTASLVYPYSFGSSQYVYRSATSTSAIRTNVIYAKASGKSWLYLFDPTNTVPVYFNLATGTLGTVASGVSATISSAGNGWYRCSATNNTASTFANFFFAPCNADNDRYSSASGTDGILVWGAQQEAGSSPTSYIPTTSATVTRAADVASMTGTNFSSWYNNNQGTYFLNAVTLNGSTATNTPCFPHRRTARRSTPGTNKMTTKNLYPNSVPSLDLNFAKLKRLDPRVTFTRASTGTYVGADGLIKTAGNGVARFDHSATGESLGLLLEEARTNYLFAYASPNYNTSSAAVYSTYSDSQFGAAENAHSWTWPSAAGAILLGWINPGSVSTTGNGVQYVISFWAKANQVYTMNGNVQDERRQAVNFAASLTTSWQYFSFSTPAGIADDGSGTVYFFWFRGAPNTAIPAGLRIDFAAVNLERGGFPTSYIPTAGSTVTRAADVATVSNTGSSVFPTSAFTTVNSPFGTAGGGTTVKLVGPTDQAHGRLQR
jgi:hypothetical protein